MDAKSEWAWTTLAAAPSVQTLSLEGDSRVREVDGSHFYCLATTGSDSHCGHKPINK